MIERERRGEQRNEEDEEEKHSCNFITEGKMKKMRSPMETERETGS